MQHYPFSRLKYRGFRLTRIIFVIWQNHVIDYYVHTIRKVLNLYHIHGMISIYIISNIFYIKESPLCVCVIRLWLTVVNFFFLIQMNVIKKTNELPVHL